MKTKLLLAVLFYLIAFNCIAQVETPKSEELQNTTTATSNNPITGLENAQTTLKQYQDFKKKIENLKDALEKSEQETIGFLNFKLKDAKIYEVDKNKKNFFSEEEKKVKSTSEIDSIYLSIKDGYINDITIYVGENIYTNKKAPIPVTHTRFTKIFDKIGLLGGTDFIIFQEIIQQEKLSQFVSDDVDFTAKKDQTKLELKKGVGINNIFDIRLYSDALALFGNEENGLVQTDLRYKNILHRRNLWNGLFYMQYIKVNFSASKFDSKDKYIDADSFTNSEVLKKSYLNAEVALNLLNGWIEFKSLSKAYLDAGFGIGSSRFRTSMDSINVTTTNFFIEGGLNLKSSSNIGLDLNAKMIRFFSPSTQDYAEYFNKQYFNFLKFGVDFYWHPFDEKANRLFARVNYYTPTNSLDKKNDFFQFQIGYSIILSEIIK